MARGLRSSRLKANNTKLRAKVFGPIEDARLQRLSKKMNEISAAPKPAAATSNGEMEVDANTGTEENKDEVGTKDEAMNDDAVHTTSTSVKAKVVDPRKEKRKIKRDGKRKPRNLIAFKLKMRKPIGERRRPPRI